jgi:hypothetical protein
MIAVLLALTTLLPHSSPDSVIRRGAPLPKVASISMAALVAQPEKFTTSPVLIEGVVVKNCTAMGCWMQLAPSAKESGLRVEFKDESFYIPLNSVGAAGRAFGVVTLKSVAAADVETTIAKGSMVRKNSDGSGTLIGFEATGVELRISGSK